MSHPAQQEFMSLVRDDLGHFFSRRRVLEIGSLDVSGSIRAHFSECEYLGLDVAEGKGVDVVCEGQKYDAPDATFDTVVSCEAMEHNPYWAETFCNMIRLCRPGGLVVMTCATTGRPEHGTARCGPEGSPLTVRLGWNYYQNLTERDFANAGDPSAHFSMHRFWTNWNHFDLLFLGVKKAAHIPSETSTGFCRAVEAIDAWVAQRSGGRVHSYRAFAAKVLGDPWFRWMHSVMDTLSWLHRAR